MRGRIPLADEISSIGPLKNRTKKRKLVVENEGNSYVDPRSSRKILKIAQDLVDDEEQAVNKGLRNFNPAFKIESRILDVENEDPGDDGEPEAWEDEDDEWVAELVSTSLQECVRELIIMEGCRPKRSEHLQQV